MKGGLEVKLLLMGGREVIGSAVIRHVIRRTDHVVVNVDEMTCVAAEDALEEAHQHPRHILERADITDASAMRQIFETHRPDSVMHLAARAGGYAGQRLGTCARVDV